MEGINNSPALIILPNGSICLQLPFNKSYTDKRPFHGEDGKVIREVDMMYKIANFNYASMPELQGHVLELPYGKENRLSMLLILPKQGRNIFLIFFYKKLH